MKRTLQILALLVVLTAAVTWLATGASRGWTKTEVQIKTLDEVTGIEGITYQKKFQPGVDFLGAAFGGAALLAGASLLFRKTSSNKNFTPSPPSDGGEGRGEEAIVSEIKIPSPQPYPRSGGERE